jgi:hypothetical protein
MVVRQFNANQARHNDLREAFILLHAKGYSKQAERLYYRLLLDIERVPNKVLYEDFQRTLMVIDPAKPQQRNLIWKYHWTVSNELEKRSEIFAQARHLAERERNQ